MKVGDKKRKEQEILENRGEEKRAGRKKENKIEEKEI